MAQDFFSIDIGESFIRVADIARSGNLFTTTAMGMLQTDPTFFRAEAESVSEKQAEALTKLLSQLKIVKKNVNIVIPDSFGYNQFFESPRLNEKELLSAIKYQADQFIPMPLEEINLDIEILKEDDKTNKILTLISAAPKKIVKKIEQFAEYSGLAPQSIETEISAVARVAGEIFKQRKDSKSGIVFINLNFSSTSVYFLDQDAGMFTFSYNFNIGYNLFLKEIQVNLNVDQKKAIDLLKNLGVSKDASYDLNTVLTPVLKDFLHEIQKAMGLLKQRISEPVSQIYTLNEATRFHAIEDIISKYFATPTSILNPYSLFVKNSIVDYFKNDLGLFVGSIGANLR